MKCFFYFLKCIQMALLFISNYTPFPKRFHNQTYEKLAPLCVKNTKWIEEGHYNTNQIIGPWSCQSRPFIHFDNITTVHLLLIWLNNLSSKHWIIAPSSLGSICMAKFTPGISSSQTQMAKIENVAP